MLDFLSVYRWQLDIPFPHSFSLLYHKASLASHLINNVVWPIPIKRAQSKQRGESAIVFAHNWTSTSHINAQYDEFIVMKIGVQVFGHFGASKIMQRTKICCDVYNKFKKKEISSF